MSIYILHSFIGSANKQGMPVRMLYQVMADYGIVFKSGRGTDETSQFWNEMRLYQGTVSGLQRSGLAESGAVLNLYHEATHAVMDIDDVSDFDWFRNAQFYYSRARLANGDKVDDTETVVDEVAAEYVGHRAVTYWNALKRLESLREILSYVSDGKLSEADGKKRILNNPVPMPVEYERAMQRTYYGYQPVSGDRQSKVMKPIYSGLLPYLDALLENRISSQFNRMPQLRQSYEDLLKAMQKFPPLLEAMHNSNYPRQYSIGHPGMN